MKKIYILIIFIVAFLCFPNYNYAQIATFSFTGASGDEATLAVDAQPANATISNMSRGSGVTAYPKADAINAYNWGASSSIDLNDYYEFTIYPDAGFEMTLTSLVLDESYLDPIVSDTYYWTVRSSRDGFNSDIVTPFSVAAVQSGSWSTRSGNTIDLTGGTFDNLTQPVTFRIYAFDVTNPGNLEWSIDNVVLSGSVAASSKTTLGTIDFESVNYTLTNTFTASSETDYWGAYTAAGEGTSHNLVGTLSGVIQGGSYLAGRDIDAGTNPNRVENSTGFDVSAYNTLDVVIAVAATGVNYDANVDSIVIEFDYDNKNSWKTVGRFSGDGSRFSVDGNIDGTGDGGALTSVYSIFNDYSFSLPKEGSLLKIRVTGFTTGGDEDILIDNIRVRGLADITAPTASAPTNTAQTLKGGTSSTSTVQSTEYGNIYLYLASEIAPTDQTEINTLISANKAFLGKNDAASGTPYTVTPLSTLVDGLYNIVAVDYAGNVSASAAGWLTVDNTAPEVVSIVKHNPATSPTNSNTVTFRVTFNEGVANVSVADFTLSGAASGTVNSVSSSSSSVYDVQINSVSGNNEILNLDFNGTHDITDIQGNAFTGIITFEEEYIIDTVSPTITGQSLATDNSYIDITFSEPVYQADGATLVTASQFNAVIVQNGGNVSSATIGTLTNTSGGALVGGELTIRFPLTYNATPSGVETVAIQPADGASVYDGVSNAMASSETSSPETLADQEPPYITSTSLDPNNAYLDVTFDEGLYKSDGTSAVLQADFSVTIVNGNATVSVSSITDNTGATLSGGESTIRFNLSITGTADGSESIEITPATNASVYDISGNATPTTETTGTINLNEKLAPTITGQSLATDNSYIDVTFSEPIYQSDGTSVVTTGDFKDVVAQNGGNVAEGDVSFSSLTKTTGGALTGGETTIRFNLSFSKDPSGVETLAVEPLDGAQVYDAAVNAMPATESTTPVVLHDQLSPSYASDVISNITDVTADYTVNIDEISTVYYVVTTSTTAPTKTQIKAGQDENGVAVTSGNFGYTSANVDQLHTITGLSSNTSNYEVYAIAEDASGNQSTIENSVQFTTLKSEPSAHVSGLNSRPTSTSAITINWSDVETGEIPDGYLVQFAINPATFTDPTDGVTISNDSNNQNITAGTESASFSLLLTNTAYDYRIIPYTNSGSDIDYYLGGTIASGTEYTLDLEPLTVISGSTESFSSTEITVTWSDVVDGDGYLIQLRDKSNVGAFYSVSDGVAYPDDNGNNDSGNINTLNIGQGIGTATFTTLDPNTEYVARIFSYSLSAGGDKNYALSYTTNETYTLKPDPANNVTGLNATNSINGSLNEIEVEWIDAIGSPLPDKYVIIVREDGVSKSVTDGINEVDDTDLSDGVVIEVDNHTDDEFHKFSGFENNTLYHVEIYSTSSNTDNKYNYKTPAASFSITSPKATPNAVAVDDPPVVVDASSITINWTAPATGPTPDGYLVLGKASSGGSYASVADEVPVANDAVFTGSGKNGAYNAGAGATSHTFTTLESGTDYDFVVYSFTNFGTTIRYSTASNEVTAATGSDFDSDLTAGAGSAIISSLDTTKASAELVFTFTARDNPDGGTPADNTGTTISSMIIREGTGDNVTDWSKVIAGVQIYETADDADSHDSETSPASFVIGTNTITISDFSSTGGNDLGLIPKNGTKSYGVKIWIKADPTEVPIDNLNLAFSLAPIDITEGDGSKFNDAGLTVESDVSTIEVIATEYRFLNQPPSMVYAKTDVLNGGNPVSLEAIDNTGNRDIDYSFGGTNEPDSIVVSNASSIPMVNVPTENISLSNGIFTFPANFQYDNIGDGTLTITDSPIGFSVTSNAVDVRSLITFATNTNGVSAGTLSSNTQNVALLGYSVSSKGPANISGLNLQANSNVTGKIKQVLLVESTDDNIYNAAIDLTAVNVLDTFDISVNPLVLKNGINISLDGLSTQRHFFIVADIEKNVNGNTPSLTLSFDETNVTASQGDIDPSPFNPATPFTNTVSFDDVSKPLVVSVTPDKFVVTDAHVADTLRITVVFDEEMDTSTAPDLSLIPSGTYINPELDNTPPTLDIAASNSLWIDNKTYQTKYFVTDNDLLSVDIGIEISAAADSSGLVMDNVTHLQEFSVDMANPLSNATALSHTVIADSTAVNGSGDKRFVVTLFFNEDMDDSGTNDPAIAYDQTVTNTLVYDSDQWVDKQTYRVFYDVLDGQETINNIGFTITNAKDSSGNIMTASGFTNLFSIDNENPVVSNILTSIKTISDSEVGTGTFAITVTYNEPMDGGTAPTISFPTEDPSATITQDMAASKWIDNFNYVAVFDVADVNERILDIDVQIATATDAYGNIQDTYNEADVFNIDGENPTVTSLTPSLAIVSDIHTGIATFSLLIDFSEEMDTTAIAPDPVITFPVEDPSSTLTLNASGGTWNSFTQFEVFYDIADVNLTLSYIDVDITLATDTVGNEQLLGNFGNVFSIDMENPDVVSVTASTTLVNGQQDSVVNDNVSGTKTFTLTVVFNEPMDISQGTTSGTEFLSFPNEDPLSTIMFNEASWTNDSTYVAYYDVTDLGERIDSVDVHVSAAFDDIGNTLNPTTILDRFDVHMDNAYVISITPSQSPVGDPLAGSQTFSLAIEFNEPMVVSVDPTIDFPTINEDPTTNITENGGNWDATGTIYTAFYDVTSSPDVTINDIDVRVRSAIDSIANNIQQESTLPDIFDLNTQNPIITNVTSPDPDGYYRVGETITIHITLDQDVIVDTSLGTPKIGLNTGDSAVFISNTTPNVLIFSYVIQINQNSSDLDYNGINSLVLNGATIRDLADNDAVLDLPSPGGAGSLGGNKDLVVDSEDPTLSDTSPFLPATDTFAVPVSDNLTFTFKENIAFTSDPTLNIYLANIDSSFVRTFNIVNNMGGILSIAGNQLIINDTVDFSESSLYTIGIDSAAIEDLAGNAYAGFELNSNTYRFQTFGTPVISGIQQNSGGTTTAVCIDSLVTIQGRFFRGYSNISNIGTVTFHYPQNSASVNADIGTLNVLSDTELQIKVPSGLDTTGFRISVAVNADIAGNPSRTSSISTAGALVGPYSADLIPGSTNLTNAVCSEGQVTTTLAVNILGGTGNYNFTYQINGTNNTNISGYVNGEDFIIEPPNSNDNDYSLFRVRDINNCPVPSPGIDPTAITIVEHTQPKIESISDLAGLCLEFSPTSVDLEATISGSTDTGIWTVQNGGGTFQSSGNNTAGYNISVNDTTETYDFVSSDFQLDTLRITLSLTNIPYPCAPTDSVVNITYTNDRVANLKGNKSVCKLTTEDPTLDINASIAGDATYGIWEAFLPDGVTPATGSFSKGDSVAVATETGSISNNYTFSSADKNQPYLLLKLTPGGGSCGDSISNTVSINVKDLPNPSNSFTLRSAGINDTIVCAGDQLKKYELYEDVSSPDGSTFNWLISDPSSGAFESENTTKSVFVNWANAADTTLIKVTERNSDGCTSDTVYISVIVNKEPIPDFNEPVGNNFGEDGSSVRLGGVPSTGGVFTGKSVSLVTNNNDETFYAFNPSTAKEGSHEITYTRTNQYSCSASVSRTFTVYALTASIIDLSTGNSLDAIEYCIDHGDVTIGLKESTKTFFKDQGITFLNFSGPGIRHINDTIAIFNPDSADVIGNINVAITVDNKGNVENIGNQTITINPKPQLANRRLDLDYCSNEPAIQLTRDANINPLETFKFFVLDGDYAALDTTNYVFDPSKVDFSSLGYDSSNFTLGYTYMDAKGCNDTTTFTTTVFNRPPAPAVSSISICQGEGLLAYELLNRVNSSQDLASISWKNATDQEVGSDVNYLPATIDNNSTSSNSFTVTQRINGCTSPVTNLTYQVLAKPVVSLSGFASSNVNICVDAEPVEVTVSSTGTDSEFSGDTTGFAYDNDARFFSPLKAADSSYTYSNTISDTVIYRSRIIYSTRTCKDSVIQIVNVKPKPVVQIDQLKSAFCPTDPQIELTGNQSGGTFIQTGPVNFESGKYYFTPSLNHAGTDHEVIYNFTDQFGCFNSDSTIFTIYNQPQPDFVWQTHPTFEDSSACVGETVYFFDRTVDSVAGEEPVDWVWQFLKPDGLTDAVDSVNQDSEHIYTSASNGNVVLTVTSAQGCKNDITKNVTIYSNPTGSFAFENICDNESTKFTALNLPDEPLRSITWKFDKEKSSTEDSIIVVTSGFDNTISHKFLDHVGYQKVTMDVLSEAGCLHTYVSDDVFTLPTISVNEANNFDFEDSNENWLPVGIKTLWEHGSPNGFKIKNSADGSANLWMTGLNTENYPGQISNGYLYSTCFDFEALDRPMVSFDLFYDVQEKIDGLVLQYATDGKDANWVVLGETGQGDNWYNLQGINSRPGNQELYGWSSDSSGWTSAKLALSDIPADKRKSVVFRFAFASGSVSSDKQLDGVAIDNFFIGNRTRTVLFEHFTNIGALNSNANARADQGSFNSYEDNDGVEVVKLAYHTGFPGADVLNKDNSGEVGARVLYYNINSIPTTVMDGTFNTYSNAVTTLNTYAPFNSWVPNQFSKRTLQAATVDIKTSVTVDNSAININALVTPKIEIQKDSLTVLVAIVEKGISFTKDLGLTNVPPGVDSSTFVMKKLLPDPLGSRFKPEINNEFSLSFDWKPEDHKIYDLNDLAVVVFVQDDSFQVYQSNIIYDIDGSNLSITGTDEDEITLTPLMIYPIPASKEVTLSYSNGWEKDQLVKVFDQSGRVIMFGNWNAKQKEMTLETANLADGIYFIQVEDPDLGIRSRKKFMVIHK